MNCQNISEGEFYTLKFSNATQHKPQDNACYRFMGWGVTLQKQSLICYPKIIGNPIVYEGRSICNENSPVFPKVLYLQTS